MLFEYLIPIAFLCFLLRQEVYFFTDNYAIKTIQPGGFMRNANVNLSSAIPQLPSGDIEKTAGFFEAKLKFQIVAKFAEYKHLIVRRDAAEIHFWQTLTEEDAGKLGSQSSCYIRVDNIQALFDEFRRNGAVFRYELMAQPWGMYEMQIDDPYGNAIRFGEQIVPESLQEASDA